MEIAQPVNEPRHLAEELYWVDNLLSSVLIQLEELFHRLRVENILFGNELLKKKTSIIKESYLDVIIKADSSLLDVNMLL